MIRFIGFLAGSLSCVLALVWIVERPLTASDAQPSQNAMAGSRPADAIEIAEVALPPPPRSAAPVRDTFGRVFADRAPPVEQPVVVPPPLEQPVVAAPPVAESVVAPPAVEVPATQLSVPVSADSSEAAPMEGAVLAGNGNAASAPSGGRAPVADTAGPGSARDAGRDTGLDTGPAAPDTDDASHWTPVWEDFRSEISARGFAGRLHQLTGFEYQVVPRSVGRYRVNVAHADDAERQARLAAIEMLTGLSVIDHTLTGAIAAEPAAGLPGDDSTPSPEHR